MLGSVACCPLLIRGQPEMLARRRHLRREGEGEREGQGRGRENEKEGGEPGPLERPIART